MTRGVNAVRGVDWRRLAEALDDRRQPDDGFAAGAQRLASEGLAPADVAMLLSVSEAAVRTALGQADPTEMPARCAGTDPEVPR